MSTKSVLVTGAGGFIGSHLCEALVQRGYNVTAFVRYNSLSSWGWLDHSLLKDKLRVISGDIRDRDILKTAMKDASIVFHLAALIGIPYSYHSPDAYVETNIIGTMNVLQVAKELGVGKIVHTSTSEVYGTANFVPITESHPINPQSPYAASKSSGDFLALSFYRSFNQPVVIVRPFNTYGPRQSARAVIPTIITQILSGSDRIKLGALSPTRDLTYVEDTVDGFILAGESSGGLGEVINLGNNAEITIGDLTGLISALLGRTISIEEDNMRKRPEKSEVERLMADNTKAKRLLNWTPKHTLRDGLGKAIAWYKSNKELFKSGVYTI